MNSTNTVEVGMGVTRYSYSDRHPYTIKEVLSPKKIVVTPDKFIRIDNNGMSENQKYEFITDFNNYEETLSLRKNGYWVPVGESLNGGSKFGVGVRSKYYDYSF